jgi:hypothetical protein
MNDIESENCKCGRVWPLLAAVAMLALSGCAALGRTDEQVWQGLHAVDAVQTNRIVGDPCYAEGHALTRDLIGAEPTHGKVLAWAVGGAVVHAGVTEGLMDLNLPRVATAWEWVSLADTGYSIEQGWKVGVRIGSPNKRTPSNNCGLGLAPAHGDVLLHP